MSASLQFSRFLDARAAGLDAAKFQGYVKIAALRGIEPAVIPCGN
jgi:hypothetical protein